MRSGRCFRSIMWYIMLIIRHLSSIAKPLTSPLKVPSIAKYPQQRVSERRSLENIGDWAVKPLVWSSLAVARDSGMLTYRVALCQAFSNLSEQFVVREISDTFLCLQKGVHECATNPDILLCDSSISDFSKLVLEGPVKAHNPLNEL